MLRRIFLRLRAVVRRSALKREMRAEMELQLARSVERLVARWIESLGGDIRFAFRHFARRPLTAITIVLVLALGIGGHGAGFSTLQAYTMRPAPGVPRDAALVRLRAKEADRSSPRWYSRGFSYPEWREIAELREPFSATVAWVVNNGVVETNPDNAAVAGLHFVTDGYFASLGVRLLAGPGLAPTRGTEPDLSVVIGHSLWRDMFDSRPDIIGQTVRVNDVSVRVVGVAPARFNGATPTNGARMLWLPLSARAPVMRTSAAALTSHDSTFLESFARLRPGVSIARATAAVGVVSARAIAQMTPRATILYETDIVPLRGDTDVWESGDAAIVVAGLAFLVLLVACTNVSALVVGASVARRQEIAIRLSLGASRARVVRQLLTESALLAVAGGALGLVVYWWITVVIAKQINDVDIMPDVGTVAFTLLFAVGTGLVFGLSPALHATKSGVADVLKDTGAGISKRSRLQRTFVVAQIAFSQPLLVGIAMLIAVIVQGKGHGRPKGVDERVIVLRLQTYAGAGTRDEKAAGTDRLVRRIASEQGVVGIVTDAAAFQNATLSVHPDDRGPLPRAAEAMSAHLEGASPGYFRALDIPILRGRELLPEDQPNQAVVIGDDLARSLWGSADPIGRRFTQQSSNGRPAIELVVVGVFDSRFSTTRGPGIRVYGMDPSTQHYAFLIRTSGPAAPLVATVRAMTRQELPSIPIGRLETLAQFEEASQTETLQVSGAAAGGGMLALVLASIGLYGVVALAVGQRRREIGIRMALGARPIEVVQMLFSSGVRLSAVGLVLGLPLSVVALNILGAQVELPKTSMPLIALSIAASVLSVASLATWIPARRAATIDPAMALRTE